MDCDRKFPKNLDPTDTFDENPGIKLKFKSVFSNISLNLDDDNYGIPVEPRADPVRAYRHENKPPPPAPKPHLPKPPKDRSVIEPSISTRLNLRPFTPPEPGAKFVVKDTKSFKELKHKTRMEFFNRVEFCDTTVLRLPSPVLLETISKTEEMSPEVSKAKVTPSKPSICSTEFPPPTKSELKRKEIRTGIYLGQVLEESDESSLEDEEDEKLKKKKKRRVVKKKKKRRRSYLPPLPDEQGQGDIEQAYLAALQSFYEYGEGEGEEEDKGPIKPLMFSKSTHVSDSVILGRYADQMSGASSATSMGDRSDYEDLSWCEIPLTSRLVQTLRDAQCEKPKKKYRKGCLENHSYTKLKQSVLTDFPMYTIAASKTPDDMCFPKVARNNQGICVPIAAFCYGQLHRPKEWKPQNLDEILDLATCHYMQSIEELHLPKGRKEVSSQEVDKWFFIEEKKLKFEISEPEVKGMTRSTDKRVFNIATGLKIFFCKYTAGLLRTENLNILIWKFRKDCYMFFDGIPRKDSLFQDKCGSTTMAMVQRLKAIRSILLDRSNIGNSPFNISQIKILLILGKDEREEDLYVKERNTYISVSDTQAVVQGSFDLGDLCFLFNRNKQALSMSIVALAYSRISAPHGWHKKTLDKILIIGNQLHSLIADTEGCPDVGVEHLPAVFTVGPFVLEMHVYPNRFADLMYKKSCCLFKESLEEFFENNNNAIAQIGKSYLGIWQQRDMFFCFDPYTRNKEGLKCRKGAACVTMNKDLGSLIDTILQNFDNRDAIFHLHAVKLIRIQRDPELSKFFPKHLTLQDMPNETFHKHKCLKSKKRAIEKPFASADFQEHALKKLLTGMSPGDSIYDVQSNLGSIGTYMLPVVDCPKLMRTPKPKKREATEGDEIVDLDSPSLSDTQIVPKRPNPYDDEIYIDDLAAFGLTIEEKELEEAPEGGEDYGEGFSVAIRGLMEGEGESEAHSEFYGVMSQVASGELDPCFRADYINTDLTYCYKLLPALELPMRTKQDRDIIIDEQQQEKEMTKQRNFEPLDNNIQILQAGLHALDVVEEDDPNQIIPYICIMAAAYDIEKPIYKWDQGTLDFVLRAGRSLYEQYAESFVHIDDFRFELIKTTFMATVEIIFNTYIGDGLFDTFPGQKVLEQFIAQHVFNQQDVGFVIVPHYACAVFFKRSLFYLFDPYNCDETGNVLENGNPGTCCLMRFRLFNDLIAKLVRNLSTRVEENDTSGMQFRMLILAKPKFDLGIPDVTEAGDMSSNKYDELLKRSQSEEFKRPSNYVKLPDGSQLIRGTKHVGNYGVEVEYISPYICLMAVAMGEKYTTRTWSSEILDFVLQAGDALYRKSKYAFIQLIKLNILKIAIGKDSFKVQVRFIFDAPCNLKIMKTAMRKVVQKEKDWVLIVTDVFTCAVCQRKGVYYLYNPFPGNELGIDDFCGVSSMARFRDLENLCLRIICNKNKRDQPEKGGYLRFALYVCRVCKRGKSEHKMKYPGEAFDADQQADELEGEEPYQIPENDEEGEGEEEGEECLVPRKLQHGYAPVTNVEVIEGSKVLARPGADQVELMEDHFANLAAALMVIHKPLDQWSTKDIDKSLDLGKHIYNHADSLEQARRRTIRNILVGRYFFDIIVKWVEIENHRYRRTFKEAMKYVMRKRKFMMLQTGEGSYTLYMDPDSNTVHLFHPYEVTFKGDKEHDDKDEANACWVKFKSTRKLIKFLKQDNNMNRFKFYTFNVINVTRAPKAVVVSYMMQYWVKDKQKRPEFIGKSFHEHESWMDLHDNPWARLGVMTSPKGVNNKWFSWDIEYNNDLYFLSGTMNEFYKCFKAEYRGKQTLCTLVAAIGMTGIYDLKEWNASVIDAILISGYKYFLKCIENIEEKDHECAMEDLLEECEIFPFKFRVRHRTVVDGTMFLTGTKRYNLYRGLRYFFEDYYYRAGIIITDKGGGNKMMVGFAKRKENEYYMFDCMTVGKPMFAPREGVAYVLRCTTLARLVHILVLTLRGGDFFIHEVIADGYNAIQGDLNPYVDEKPKLRT